MRTKQQQSNSSANNQTSYGRTAKANSTGDIDNTGATLTKSRIITNVNELLPGLNDISDAFEALPIDLIKYFTLLKEIDAKCINTIPQINYLINQYITNLHQDNSSSPSTTTTNKSDNSSTNGNKNLETKRLNLIKNKINEVIPCLEEKMHVTSVASDLLNKHMHRINQDYKLIVLNNEIPQSIRIGPLNHPAMINDTHTSSSSSTSTGNGTGGGTNNNHAGNNSVQSQRSESRREALAARKANKEDDRDNNTTSGSGSGRKKKKELNNNNNNNNNNAAATGDGNNSSNGKKRNRDDKSNNAGGGGNDLKKKKKQNNNDQLDNRRKGEDDSGKRDLETGFNSGNKNDPHGKLKTTSTGGNLVGGSTTATTISSSSTTTSSSATTATTTTTKNSGSTGASTVGGGAKGSSSSSSSGNNEPTYCYCNQVSFGEMVGCDGDDCKREWFHLPCIGFKNPPKGKWYCDDCIKKLK